METRNRGEPRRSIGLTVSIALVLLLGMLGIGWLATRDREVAPLPNHRAPEFKAMLMGGRPVHLSDYRGKVVLLNIWATWCKPCEEEAPSLERLYQTIKAGRYGADFEVLAVSIDATRSEAVLPFQSKFSLTFPILFDPDGRVSRLYQTTGVPESFVIDKQGIIREKIIGPREWDRPDTVDWFRDLLAETQAKEASS